MRQDDTEPGMVISQGERFIHWAARIEQALDEARDGLTSREIAEVTGLTSHAVSHGLAYLLGAAVAVDQVEMRSEGAVGVWSLLRHG